MNRSIELLSKELKDQQELLAEEIRFYTDWDSSLLEEKTKPIEAIIQNLEWALSILNSENTGSVSDVEQESGALHDVVHRTDHGSEPKTSVERPLSSMPNDENIKFGIALLKWAKDGHSLDEFAEEIVKEYVSELDM